MKNHADQWTGRKIKMLRRHMGMTQLEFGQQFLTAPPSTVRTVVSRLENDVHSPTAAVLHSLNRLAAEHGFEPQDE